ARSRIKNPEDMGPFLEQLADKGFWAEAKILQADSAKARKKPLHELGFLLQLTNAIKMTKRTAPVFHRLALLLEELNEPQLATEYFVTIEPFLEGAENIIHSLKANPLYNLDQEKTIRSDISPLKLAIQEMEKETVLRRPFRWRLIIPSREPRVFVIQALHSLNLWEKRVQKQTSSKGRNIEMEQEKVVFFDGQNIRQLGWLKISQIGIKCPSPYLDYAIEINQENGQAQGYGIFNPNKMISSIDNLVTHSATLAQTYQSIHQRREVEYWLNKVHDRLRELDRDSSFTRS
ncbi:MAG: hypothetical protein JRI49_07210, partial [Deltaproteobacteria bacterium]|nr:hypothetical protein [Deltaproteobacteria bacterium]